VPFKNLDLFIVAAEPSADKQGAEIVSSLLKKTPSLNVAGVLGPKLRKLPIKCLMPMEKLLVMGFVDVLMAMPKIIFRFFYLKKMILRLNPKAVLFIDYPEFNLRLERALKRKKFKGKIFHHICPTVWAWAKSRVNIMNQGIDHLFTIFPFEKDLFTEAKFTADYVGHPLAYKIANYPYNPVSFQKNHILGIFPGSRTKELSRNLPLQLAITKQLLAKHPNITPIISIGSEDKKPFIDKIVQQSGLEKYQYASEEENYDLMKNCHFAVATSGTVTLELALHKVPTVVTFAIKMVDLIIAQKILKIDLPFFCIVNILCQKFIFPELFGPNLTPNKLFYWMDLLYLDTATRENIVYHCDQLAKQMLKNDPSHEISKKMYPSFN